MTQDIRVIVQDYDFRALETASYDQLVEMARGVTDAHDRNRFALGDIGAAVETRYGAQSIQQFAGDVGVKLRQSTFYEYVEVARFYPAPMRAEFSTLLSWSHFRVAMRLKDIESARMALQEAHDGTMSVKDFTALVRNALGEAHPPVVLYTGGAVVVAALDGVLTVKFTSAAPVLGDGQQIEIKITEAA